MDVLPTQERVDQAYRLADPCRICPRECRVRRLGGQAGYCKIGSPPLVASAGPHYGEEPPLVGRGGSGTIFLAGCNLLCEFCQNYDISHGALGTPSTPAQIARIMLSLEHGGCENINFVTPTHVTPWVMDAIRRARRAGLRKPIVYNCGGYERVETLRLLEGTVDVYMPDTKFWDPATAARLCHAPDYPDTMRAALREMHRQVGVLRIENGVAQRGLLIRHLVMPNAAAGTREVLEFIAEEISSASWVNVMAQYRPLYRAPRHEDIDRGIKPEEFRQAMDWARQLGLNTL